MNFILSVQYILLPRLQNKSRNKLFRFEERSNGDDQWSDEHKHPRITELVAKIHLFLPRNPPAVK